MTADAPSPRFDGQTVVVTGVGRAGQLGEVVARDFGQRGAKVVIIDRDPALVEERAAALRGEGLSVVAYACDLTDSAATLAIASEIAAASKGLLHALANVAGGFAMSGPVAESDPEIFQRQLTINLGSAYGATRAFLPALRAARGSIIFMAAAAVLPGGKTAGMSGYAASKAGVIALMQAVAQEEEKHGVRANALAPTAIRTGVNEKDMGSDRRYVERESVAAMIAMLCSPTASNVTGQVITLA